MHNLVTEFECLGEEHQKAMKKIAAKQILGPSVIRVFHKSTKEKLLPKLPKVKIDILPKLTTQEKFKKWFEKELNKIARTIKKCNANNNKIYPGYKWGHSTKVLTLYIRNIVLYKRYFTDKQVKNISKLLYTPIDGKAIRKLRTIGFNLPFNNIKGITQKRFYDVQEKLAEAAYQANVPRIWFDDIWGDLK